jgi:hypothetical protein
MEKEEDGGALGPMIGLRRPNYGVLDEVLGPWAASWRAPGERLAVFVNLNSALRQLFTEYAAANVTSREMNGSPRALASELFNLAGHYRNYFWKRHGRGADVLLYHSTERCPERVAAWDSYKESLYSKRIDPPSGPARAMRNYVDFNLRVLQQLLRHAPNAHLVDTGPLDPEAWPGALMADGRVGADALVVSGWFADLQYALAAGVAVLQAKGANSKLVTSAGLLGHALRGSKTAGDSIAALSPEHFRYVLALAGDGDLGAPGLTKYGPAKAAALVARRVAAGGLPPEHVGIEQLAADGRLDPAGEAQARRAWALLDQETYVGEWATPARMAAVDAQMVNRDGNALEEADAKYFRGRPLSLDLIFAGEEY